MRTLVQIFYLGGDPRMYCEGVGKGEKSANQGVIAAGTQSYWGAFENMWNFCLKGLRSGMFIHQLSCFAG